MKLLFSFLLTVASLSAFAQQTIKISGRVTDFNDKPISNLLSCSWMGALMQLTV